MKLVIILLSASLVILVASLSEFPSFAVSRSVDQDFVKIETANGSYSIDLDYVVSMLNNTILKNRGARQDTINASSYDTVHGEFNSSDHSEILYFDAFLVKKRRIDVSYENNTIGFRKIHHLLNLECIQKDNDNNSCYSFYGELPFRKKPGFYRLVFLAHFDNFTKYYITKMNINGFNSKLTNSTVNN